MKKVDADEFVSLTIKELDNFMQYQSDYSSFSKKTFLEWYESFSEFVGFSEKNEEEIEEQEFDDNFYYGQDLQFEDLVNRRKYRSFRDDDGY